MSLKEIVGAVFLTGMVGLSGCAVKQELRKPTPVPEKQYQITIEKTNYSLKLELKDEWLIIKYQSNPGRIEDILERHLGSAMGDIHAGEILDSTFEAIDREALRKKIRIIKDYMQSQTEKKKEQIEL